jgi:hypothetical protein
MFERADSYATTYPRVYVDLAINFVATTNGSQIALATGSYIRQSGSQTEIANNDTNTVTTVSTDQTSAFAVNYTIARGTTHRTGTILISSVNGTGNPVWSDDFVQNIDPGVTLSVTQVDNIITVVYTSSNTGVAGTINYSINYLA